MPSRDPSRRRPRPGAKRNRATPTAVETTVFRSGNSDAVRLPKAFSLVGQRVRLRRLGDGRVVLEPTQKRRWPRGFLESFGRVSPDFEVPERPAPEPAHARRDEELFPDSPADE